MKLDELLFNILTKRLVVWLWSHDGHCVYIGSRFDALTNYGRCQVTGWRIDENHLRANIITEGVCADGG